MSGGWSDGRPFQKYAYLDHDADIVNLSPPVLNQWYEVFHAYDVRLLWCIVRQGNTEAAAKNVEVRWTIDGNVYHISLAASDATLYWIYRNWDGSFGGTAGLASSLVECNAAHYVDKRGQDFKVEVRITSALGTNQTLGCWCVHETLEVT